MEKTENRSALIALKFYLLINLIFLFYTGFYIYKAIKLVNLNWNIAMLLIIIFFRLISIIFTWLLFKEGVVLYCCLSVIVIFLDIYLKKFSGVIGLLGVLFLYKLSMPIWKDMSWLIFKKKKIDKP